MFYGIIVYSQCEEECPKEMFHMNEMREKLRINREKSEKHCRQSKEKKTAVCIEHKKRRKNMKLL